MIRPRTQAAGHPSFSPNPRHRVRPLPGRLARRRILITLTKLLLPIGAAALLAAIALWPEFDRTKDSTRFTFSNVSGEVEGARLKNARYHGFDEKGRPYTVTAATVRQLDAERVELSLPKGDLTEENGVWLMLRAEHGIFMQKTNVLDLWRDVVLYRDDGTTLTTASATVDIRQGSATGGEAVHAEGPFGVLDAAGFTITDKGALVQFAGPARVTMRGAQP